MDPEQQKNPNNSANDDHRLDFILETELPKQKSFWEKLKTPIGVVFLAICAVIIAILIAIPIYLNKQAEGEQTERIISLSQTQTEIIRISDLAQNQAEQEAVKSRASEISTTFQDQLDQTLGLLSARGVNTDSIFLSAKEDSQTDSQIVASIQAGNFDSVFSGTIDEMLLNYQRELFEVQSNSSEKEKEVFSRAYAQTNSLLGLVDQEQGNEDESLAPWFGGISFLWYKKAISTDVK